jgi:hypothetical protein
VQQRTWWDAETLSALLELENSQLALVVGSPEFQFFSKLVRWGAGTFAERVERAVRADQHVFPEDVRKQLADAFLAVACLENARAEYWDGREGSFSRELLGRARLAGAMHFLERQADHVVICKVNRNLRNADRRGGIGFVETIRGHLNLERRGRVIRPWAILYYTLRCGAVDAARTLVRDNRSDFDQDVIEAVDIFGRRMALSAGLAESLQQYFGEESATLQNNFKMVTLAVLT